MRGRAIPAIALPLLLAVAVVVSPQPAAHAQGAPPNVVIVVVDDLRYDSLWAMPQVRNHLVAHGISFTDAFVVNSSCCPSRTSLLTGLYSHSTGVYRNRPPYGGFESFDDSSTLATWLDNAGYRTALIGKYLNGYQETTYVPPGWDRWEAFIRTSGRGLYYYYDYGLNVDGSEVSYGTEPGDYSTDVLAEKASRFVSTAPEPFFVYLAPAAVHGPAIPAPRDANVFDTLSPWRPRSYDEEDVSDKPEWVQQGRRLDAERRRTIDRLRRHQLEALLAVDDAVGDVIDSLKASGRLDDTLVVFTSDNGYLWGEHRLVGKGVAYEESIRVPLVVRYDAMVAEARAVGRMVLNIDIAPTVVELSAASAPSMDGQSLVPFLRGAEGFARNAFAIEHLATAKRVPTYCALRTNRFLYVLYDEGKNELYPLHRDRFELRNRIHEAKRRLVRILRDRLRALCDPPPPRFKREI